MSSKTISLLLLAPVALAQTVHVVQVGDGGLNYNPSSLTAAVGDQVEFHFSPFHSVTQGSFANPCAPLDGGFNSGVVTSSSSAPFTITIKDPNPIYYYCSVSGHCPGGMAAAINAPSGQSADQYIAAAKKSSGDTNQPSSLQGGVFASATSNAGTSSATSASSAVSSSASASMTSAAASSMVSSASMSSSVSARSSSMTSGSSKSTAPSSTSASASAAGSSTTSKPAASTGAASSLGVAADVAAPLAFMAAAFYF